MRQARSTEECACSEATTTRRSGSAVRAAHSAASVEIEAVSSMWPCHVGRQVEQLAEPRERELLEFGDRRRRAPEHAVGVHRRRQQLREDARVRRRDAEVGEEARVVPVRDARQQHAVEVGEHVGERLGRLGRRGRQARADLARLDRRHHVALADALEVVGRPVDRGVAVGPELLRIRHAREARGGVVVCGWAPGTAGRRSRFCRRVVPGVRRCAQLDGAARRAGGGWVGGGRGAAHAW